MLADAALEGGATPASASIPVPHLALAVTFTADWQPAVQQAGIAGNMPAAQPVAAVPGTHVTEQVDGSACTSKHSCW